MQQRTVILIAVISCCVCAGPATGQRLHGTMSRLDNSYRPYDIEVTPDGRVWLTHTYAVVRIDPETGATFGYFPPDPDKSFWTLDQDNNGMLWVADSGGRLYHFDTSSMSFTKWDIPAATFPSGCAPHGVTVGPQGKIWFTCWADNTIGRLDPVAASWTRFLVAGSQLPDPPVDIAFDGAGIAWFTIRSDTGTSPGFGWLDPADPSAASSGWQVSSAEFFLPYGIVFSGGYVWFVDKGWNLAEGQLVRIDPVTRAYTRTDLPDEVDDAHYLTVGPNGRLYSVGFASSTMLAYDPATGTFLTEELGRSFAWPMGITTDREGRIWWAESGSGSDGGAGYFTPFGPSALAIGTLEGLSSGGEGAVTLLYGTTNSGLSVNGHQLWTEDSPGVDDDAEADDLFGWAMAAGDFDGDGAADLAVGVPAEDVNGIVNAGAVHLLYGSGSRLVSSRNDQIWHQNSGLIQESAEIGDNFGRSLASGDLNGDGFDDLVVGVQWEGVGNPERSKAGAVHVLFGTASGLTDIGNQLWYQSKDGIANLVEVDDEFGAALATGDFDNDGYDDLVIGVPLEDWSTLVDSGVVQVLYGSVDGPVATDNQLWRQGADGLLDTTEAGDELGHALTVGDFNNDGYDDLAIGVPYEGIDSEPEAGAVAVLYGTSGGLSATGDDLFHQGTGVIDGELEDGDYFGSSLAAGDFDGDWYDDLAIGVPFESVSSSAGAGAVNVLYGSASGLLTAAASCGTRTVPILAAVQSSVTASVRPWPPVTSTTTASATSRSGFPLRITGLTTPALSRSSTALPRASPAPAPGSSSKTPPTSSRPPRSLIVSAGPSAP